MTQVVVIGAGMAGLACARRLSAAGVQALVLDKGRGIGGRLATRRADGLQFDHGAQYVTATGEGFAAVLRGFADEGTVARWQDGSGRTHLVGVPGMTALAKAMATGLEIRQLAQVTGIARQSDGWHLRVGDGEVIASRLILTVPAPQAAALLGADHPLQGALRAVRMDPCLTLMAGVRAPAPYLTRKEPEDALSWIAQDSSKPGRPGGDVTAWVAQAGTAFSRQHLETDPAGIAALMLPMLADRLGVALDTVTHASAHRWRYARAVEPLGRPFLRDDDARLYLGGDWCLGPRVEAAWTSGTAIAEDMLARMS